MSQHPAYSISGTVNGVRLEWTYKTLDAVMLDWDRVRTHRVAPGTKDPITAPSLAFDGTTRSSPGEPYGGLAVP